jgi:hypothetical protein
MCVSPHDRPRLCARPAPRTCSSARGDRIKATGRPCFTISTQPKAATAQPTLVGRLKLIEEHRRFATNSFNASPLMAGSWVASCGGAE